MKEFRTHFLLALICALSGCTTDTQNFGRFSNEEVWSAMLAVASSPDYNDPDPTKRWIVRDNEVWTDEAEGRIEIHRHLERILIRPRSKELHEWREWRFAVTLNRTDIPEERWVKFVSRGAEVPARAARESEVYFDQVREILGENPRAARELAATQPVQSTTPKAPPMESERR